jgi:DNA-binding NarL/FixJ family response regulator
MQEQRARRRTKGGNDANRLSADGEAVAEVHAPRIGFEPGSISQIPTDADVLIVIERRDFIRGCLVCWLDNLCDEFATLPVADAETSLDAGALGRATAVLVGVDAPEYAEAWLIRQVGWLRAKSPSIPIIMMVEADETRAAEALASRLNVQGYIPTSSNVNVAAAALRLVLAGGRYFPTLRDHDRQPAMRPMDPARLVTGRGSLAKLTPREAAVLGVLGSGAPNKIIAHRLGMSLSTVKAHVHSIIRKLNVGNRTEVVVAARNMQLLAQQSDGEPAFDLDRDVWGRRNEHGPLGTEQHSSPVS